MHLDGIINNNTQRIFEDKNIGEKIASQLIKLGVMDDRLLRIARFLGSPKQVYKNVISQSKKFNNYLEYKVDIRGLSATIITKPLSDDIKKYTDCSYEIGIYKSIPTIWDLPFAEVEHDICIKKGDPICKYYITWTNKSIIQNILDYFDIRINNQKTLFDKMRIVESFDPNETGKHINRVSAFSEIICEEIYANKRYSKLLLKNEIKKLRIASKFHDVGKFEIDRNILKKKGRLSKEEFEEIKSHTILGANYFDDKNDFGRLCKNICMYHHERWDGNGYPKKIKRNEIPLFARIVSVADVFDAVKFPRSYKEEYSFEKAFGIIEKGRGTQFDPSVVDAFFRGKRKIMKLTKKYSIE